jgi:hypothetical protein
MIAGLPFLLEIGHPASNTDTLGRIVLVAPTSDSDAACSDEIIVFRTKKSCRVGAPGAGANDVRFIFRFLVSLRTIYRCCMMLY